MPTYMVEKRKVVALLSGGLDSQLAVRMMQEKGFDVSAVAIRTPFCDFDCGRGCGFEIRERADQLNVDLKTVYLGDEYIEMLKKPKYGRGAGFNPCVDCRAMMFEAAKKEMDRVGADFVISGEVLGQRPMSQHRRALKNIEAETDMEGVIVRPLSGRLLPPTKPERDGLIRREDLGMIRGRSRKPQLAMASEYGIEDPPNAGGGCLLTDPSFGLRAKDLFEHTKTPSLNDIELLKVGRQHRLDEHTKMVVGRHQAENETIRMLGMPDDILFEAQEYVGPTTILRGETAEKYITLAASVTLKYSDAPDANGCIRVWCGEDTKDIVVSPAVEDDYIQFRI